VGPPAFDSGPVPAGIAVFAHDNPLSVQALAERVYPIDNWFEFDRGGHFAAPGGSRPVRR